MKNLTTIGVALGVLTIAVATFLWLGRGYGTVSPDAYQVAQALYSSCLAKSEVRLEAVESMINDAGEQPCLLYTSPSPRDATLSRMPSSA